MAKVLVVDDNPTARELIVTVLGYAGHQVREAADGTEALARVETHPPDLIIADLLMPTMDGFEFVRQLRAKAPFSSTPVIFYTATYLEREARHLAEACGVGDIITKPAEPEEILRAVSRNLELPAASLPQPLPVEEFREKHLGLLLAKLSQKAEAVVPRLDAMIELGLQLASERDPQQLLTNFCSAARKIIAAKYAVIGLIDKKDQTLRCQYMSGMNLDVAASLKAQPIRLPEAMRPDPVSIRFSGLSGDVNVVGLPNAHPPVNSLLAVPITSPDRTYGWLFLTDRIGADAFGDEDEGLARILAAQVGRIYESGSLYSELKKLNVELEERVADRTRELEAFSYSVSHDLRAPLRAIDGFSRILLTEFAPHFPEEARTLLEHVNKGVQRMSQLIEDLLRLSQLGQHALRKGTVSMLALVRETVGEQRREEREREVEVRIGELPDCEGDPALLKQVWVNLLSNAFKFTRQRQQPLIEVGSRHQGAEIVYFVKDNGAGFDMKNVERLFDVFQRLHDPAEFEGTGVGLALVRRIVQRHGGKVWAEGAVDQGATLYFTIPASEVTD